MDISAHTPVAETKSTNDFWLTLRTLFAGKKCMLCNLPKTTLAYIRHELYRSQTMKQKPQVRVLIALVPAAFVFSDYDEYAAVSYSFTRVVFYLAFLYVHLPFVLRGRSVDTSLLVDAKKICYNLSCVIEFGRDAMFYTDEEISVITGFLNGYLVRDCASAKVRESYIRISAGLQSHTLTKDDYVWLENALLFLRPYWWSDREDGKMLMDAFLHTQTLAKEE